MKTTVYLVKAFTKDKDQGNPAGVVLHAEELSAGQMQTIARDLSFSESAFVTTSKKADYHVRFFSPTQEVAFCGHATIATFHMLFTLHMITVGNKPITVMQETKAGIFPLTIYPDGFIEMTQKLGEFLREEKDRVRIAQLLGIKENHILHYSIEEVSTVTRKLIIPVDSLKTLFAIKPDLEGIKQYCQETGSQGFYPFTTETKEKDADFHARQFSPLAGIPEDPTTGVAAGPLGCYAIKHKLTNKNKFVIEQGYIMNKAGKLFVDVTHGVKVGGYAVKFGERIFEFN